MDETTPEEWDRKRMAERVTDKVWNVPAYEGSGPVTISLRVPEVTITDSAGRYIVISPRQSGILSSRLDCIDDWLQHGMPLNEKEVE